MKVLVVSHSAVTHHELCGTRLLAELAARDHCVEVITGRATTWVTDDAIVIRRPADSAAELREWLDSAVAAYDGALVIAGADEWSQVALERVGDRIPTVALISAGGRPSAPTIPRATLLVGEPELAARLDQKQRARFTALAAMPPSMHATGQRQELIVDSGRDPALLSAIGDYARRRTFTVVDAGAGADDAVSWDRAAALVVAGPVQSWNRVFHALRCGVPLLVTTHDPELLALVESQRCGLVLTSRADCLMAVDLLGVPTLFDHLRRRAIEATAAMVCQTNASTIERLLTDAPDAARPSPRPAQAVTLDETLATRLLVALDLRGDLDKVTEVVRAGLNTTTLVVWLDPDGDVTLKDLELAVADATAALSEEPDILVVVETRSPDNVASVLRQIDAIVEPSRWWSEMAGAWDRPVIRLTGGIDVPSGAPDEVSV
jgi:hypothetical protein